MTLVQPPICRSGEAFSSFTHEVHSRDSCACAGATKAAHQIAPAAAASMQVGNFMPLSPIALAGETSIAESRREVRERAHPRASGRYAPLTPVRAAKMSGSFGFGGQFALAPISLSTESIISKPR